MSRRFRLPALALGLVLLPACDSDPAPASAPASSPRAASHPAPAAAGGVLDVPGLNAAREAHIGQVVQVRGVVLGITHQGKPVEQINVAIGVSDDIASETVLCVAAADDTGLSATPLQRTVTVEGTVSADAYFDKARLDGCHLAGTAAPAAPRSPPARGKRSKRKKR